MWKDILKTVAVVAAISCGSVLLIGFVVSREQEARCEALYQKRPRDVWESLSDIQAWREWMPGVDYVVALRDQGEHPKYQVTGPAGSVVVEIVESKRPERLVFSTTGESFTQRRTYILSTSRRISSTSVGLALPRVSRMTRPFSACSAFSTPLL